MIDEESPSEENGSVMFFRSMIRGALGRGKELKNEWLDLELSIPFA
jgi:hypothetical protein